MYQAQSIFYLVKEGSYRHDISCLYIHTSSPFHSTEVSLSSVSFPCLSILSYYQNACNTREGELLCTETFLPEHGIVLCVFSLSILVGEYLYHLYDCVSVFIALITNATEHFLCFHCDLIEWALL